MTVQTKRLIKDINIFCQKVSEFRRQNGFQGTLEYPRHTKLHDDGSLECHIRFIAIPQKATSRSPSKRKISVLLIGKMTPQAIGSNGMTLAAYNTEALYCNLEKQSSPNQLEAVHGFHFDYEYDVPWAHPVFHVHYDITVSSQWFTERDRGLVLTNEACIQNRTGHRSIRIPTAQMDLFSVILMVIAGHWINGADSTAVIAFSKLLADTQSLMPKVDLSIHKGLFDAHLKKFDHLRANTWYPISR